MAKQTALVLVAGVVAVGAGLFGALREDGTAPARRSRVSEPEAVVPAEHTPLLRRPEDSPRIAAPASAAPAVTAPRAEASLMAELRELGESNPPLSMQLAREGNDRFPGGAGAAERAWIVVKSLVDMGRFDEAQAEARFMVDKYAGTSWAADVERHLLSNPLYEGREGESLD